MTIAEELRALAERVPADGPPAGTLARQRAVGAAEAVAAALTADPTLAERQQRWLDVLAELLRRLTPLAARPRRRPSACACPPPGPSTVHLGRINPLAAEELDAVSARCPELAGRSLPRPGLTGVPRSASASYRAAGCPASMSRDRRPAAPRGRVGRGPCLPRPGSWAHEARRPDRQADRLRGVVPLLHQPRRRPRQAPEVATTAAVTSPRC